MNRIDTQPGVAVVDHEYPKHRCPLCNHVCHTSKRLPKVQRPGYKSGRPPTARTALLDALQNTTKGTPISTDELLTRLGINVDYLFMLIYRARRRGYPIRWVRGGGYYLGYRTAYTDARLEVQKTQSVDS